MYKQFWAQQKAADCHGDGLITESKDKIWMVGLVYTIFAMIWLIGQNLDGGFGLYNFCNDLVDLTLLCVVTSPCHIGCVT